MNVLDIFVLKRNVESYSTEIVIESNFWLRMLVQCSLKNILFQESPIQSMFCPVLKPSSFSGYVGHKKLLRIITP